MLNQSSHAPFKMGKYKDSHIPTSMLDNKANLLSHIFTHQQDANESYTDIR